jgi:hypothetical protein
MVVLYTISDCRSKERPNKTAAYNGLETFVIFSFFSFLIVGNFNIGDEKTKMIRFPDSYSSSSEEEVDSALNGLLLD